MIDEDFWEGKELPEDWWKYPEILEKLFNEKLEREIKSKRISNEFEFT